MINMKQSAEEAKEQSEKSAIDMPEYPYGLCLSLDDDALEKLGITALPKVGSVMTITAKAYVKGTSAYNTQGGESESRMELQITDMEIGAANDASASATMLYGENT
jgi:hypothetical protein